MAKYGVREICDVVLRAKAAQKIGNKIFYKHEPVMYFDTLKTSSLEGAATTVYAQGGRGNSRLMAWEGERTVTFNMEDALISPEGLAILTGAGLVESSSDKPLYQHMTETVDRSMVIVSGEELQIPVSNLPYLPAEGNENFAYVMLMKDGEIVSEPLIPVHGAEGISLAADSIIEGASEDARGSAIDKGLVDKYYISVKDHVNYIPTAKYENGAHDSGTGENNANYDVDHVFEIGDSGVSEGMIFQDFDAVLIDYYVERKQGLTQIEIAPDKFGGYFYLEASTLFRDQNGVDWPAEFIIPSCKVQSNFTFTMASSGDPSTFSFVLDAFPDYLRFDHSKKVLAAIQVLDAFDQGEDLHRHNTPHEVEHERQFTK